jgi:hypothetical protein
MLLNRERQQAVRDSLMLLNRERQQAVRDSLMLLNRERQRAVRMYFCHGLLAPFPGQPPPTHLQ